MRILSVVLVIFMSTGCTSSNKSDNWHTMTGWMGLRDQQKLERSSRWALNRDANLYIAIPPQEVLDVELHGELTLLFQRYYPKARAAIHRESLHQSFVSAQYSKMDYLVYPRVKNRQTPHGLGEFIKGDIQLAEVNRGEFDMDLLIFTANEEQLVDWLQVKTRTGIFSSKTSSLLLEPIEEYLRKASQ